MAKAEKTERVVTVTLMLTDAEAQTIRDFIYSGNWPFLDINAAARLDAIGEALAEAGYLPNAGF